MELHHLHVAQRQPVAQRHRESVAALVARRRVKAVHRRPAAGREQHGLRLDEHVLAGPDVDQQDAGKRAVAIRNEIERAVLLEPGDAARPHLLGEPIHDLDAGEVALVHGAIERLPGERLLVDRAVGIAIEEAAELVFELVNALDRAGDERPRELLIGEPLAAFDRVHEMTLDRIGRRQRDVVAALDHARAAALAEQPLDGDRDVQRRIGACACSAANRPAPPAPRIRMSVRRVFIAACISRRAAARRRAIASRGGVEASPDRARRRVAVDAASTSRRR